jgi:hypothetical protein
VLQSEPAERTVLLDEGQQHVFRDFGRTPVPPSRVRVWTRCHWSYQRRTCRAR